MSKTESIGQIMLGLALSEREAALADSTVCPQHKGTTVEVTRYGLRCPMCDLDEAYAISAGAKRWWERPVQDSPRPLPVRVVTE